jgi:hypothetical protein
LNSAGDLRKRLLACQKYHIRPLILLNANSGAPGPTRFFDRSLAAAAHAGDRQVELTDVNGLVVGYSGFRNITDNRASEALVTDAHEHVQFSGDGTPAHPNLYDRDVFALLPFQVNTRKFVLAYYVMTRDVTKRLPPEQYTLRVRGIRGKRAVLRAYDPVLDKNVGITVRTSSDNGLTLTLTATDYPCLLIVQEH